MKRFILLRWAIVCLCCMVFSCKGAPKTEESGETGTVDVQRSVSLLKDKVESSDFENKAAILTELNSYNANSTDLHYKLEAAEAQGANIDSKYVDAVNTANLNVAMLYESNITDGSKYMENLKSINEDFAVKLEGFDETVANAFAPITIQVRAKSGENVLIGYSVAADCLLNAPDEIQEFKANNLTDDAKLTLPIGRYMIYLVKDGMILQKRIVNINYVNDKNIIFIL